MKKIGLMGGTFDPVHNGHLLAAESVRERMALDEIWFMPSYRPPHKPGSPGANAEQRWEMVCLALRSNPHFRPLDIELKRGGVSYTVDTIRQLRQSYPGHSFYFIIGADMINMLPQWRDIERLARGISFIGVKRPGTALHLDRLPDYLQAGVALAEMPQFDISSTQIRARAAAGQSIRYLVPEEVRHYIQANRLYESIDGGEVHGPSDID